MSRYGLIFQLTMATLFAVMALIMGVVLLCYLIYIDADPRMARDLPVLTRISGWFLLGSLIFTLGSWSQWRVHRLRWLMWLPELGVIVALVGMIRSLRLID